MKLYENVVIGNFLYGLGVSIGGRLKSSYLPGAVSLLQQTPEDKALGDVLIAFPGTLRLIEFKAKGNRSGKEADRYQTLSIAINDDHEVQNISRRVHWYVETRPSSNGVETFFSPYIDAFKTKPYKYQTNLLERFIETIADDVFSSECQERSQMEKDYLKLVRWCQGVGETGAGALIVIVGSGGKLDFVALEDLIELNMSYSQWMAYQHQRDLKRENMLQITMNEKKLDRDLGMEL